MKDTVVARRYAKAFAEAFNEPSALKTVGEELKELAAVFGGSHLLRNVMLNPAMSMDIKKNVLEELLKKSGASKGTVSAMRLILDKERVAILGEIAEEFEKISFEVLGKARIGVTSAMELSGEEKELISAKLSEITGKEAVISMDVDSSLIGGIVAKIGSYVYDGSVKNQLKALRVGLR